MTDVFAAFRWWAILMILGIAATPLLFVVCRRLPDRGYAFVKMAGLLIVSYLFWIMGSLGFLGNNLGSIIVAVLALGGLSAWLYRREQSPNTLSADPEQKQNALFDWLRENRTQIILTELLFALIFILWVWVRAQNPAITATEKPMEFAFLNAVGRSPQFPPLDPWLSGFAISYYYFGYVMTSVIARLAFVPEAVAFNLAIAWLVAGTAVAAFGLVYNLLATQGARRSARILGLIAALALPIAGNMEIALEVAHANNIGSTAFWQWLDVRDLNSPPTGAETPRYETSSWWWWRSSRPLHEYHLSGRPEEGLEPIVETPAFSFVLGDLHPHVLALPFAFMSLAIAFVWYLQARSWQFPPGNWRWRTLIPEPALWLFTALLLGGLSFLNTWDVLIHLFVVLGAFLLARWRAEGWHGRILSQTIIQAVVLLIPAVLLYLPFYLGFRSQAGAPYLLPMLMRPTRLAQFLIIFGMPLWVITIMLLAQAVRQRFRFWQWGLVTAVTLIAILFLLSLFFGTLIAISPDGAGRVFELANELGINLADPPAQSFAPTWGIGAVAAILPYLIRAKLTYSTLTLFLTVIVGLVIMIWREEAEKSQPDHEMNSSNALPFVLLLVGTGTLLTLGPEFLYLLDNFGQRLNTIFKFYYQAWVLFGVAALYGLGYLWQAWRGSQRAAPIVATLGYGLALLLALLFPLYAINSRAVEYRGPERAINPTLNGLAHLQRQNPDEYAAIEWLRKNAVAAPVIVEAVGGQYSGYGRFAANTGLPTILGWAGHEYQWRGNTPEPGQRDPAVHAIYSEIDFANSGEFLNNYGVKYIIVGELERSTYGPQGMDKFAAQLEPAFSTNSVTIYHWQADD